MASIEKRRGASGRVTWRVWWRLGGGRAGERQSCTFEDARLAESARSLVEARHHDVTRKEVYAAVLGVDLTREEAAPTVGEWAAKWIADRRAVGDIQADTLRWYQRLLMRQILPYLGHLPLTALTPDVVRDWVTWLCQQPSRRGKPLAPASVHRAHAVLHALLGAAVPRWLSVNPATRRRGQRSGLPKVVPFEPVFLEAWEVDLLIANSPPAIRDLVFMLARTGLRLGEALALQTGDVTITTTGGVIRVRRALKQDRTIGTPKSRRSRRDVPLSREVAAVLAPLVVGRAKDALVFPSPEGKLWHEGNLRRRYWAHTVARSRRCAEHPPPLPSKARTGPRRQWRPEEVSTCDCPGVMRRAPRIHDLRHTFVSMALSAGWPILDISRVVGHDSVATTLDLYGHLDEANRSHRLDALDSMFRALRQDVALLLDDEAC